MQKIYIELVFIDNFIVNLLILLFASLLTKTKIRWGRLAAGAGIGGAYACVAFGTSGFAVSLPAKLAVSALVCAAAFYAKGGRGFLKNVCAFYLTSFVFAGSVYAASFSLGGPNALVMRPLTRYILAGLAAGAGLCAVFARIRRRTAERERSTVDIELSFGERHVTVKAFADTGNMLTEPLSGLYVVFVTASAAARLFDKEAINIMNCRGGAVTDRLRIVPCTTASGSSVFCGMEIDRIALKGHKEGMKAVVCIARGTLAYGCDAVIGSGLVDELMKGAEYDKVSRAKDCCMDTGADGDSGQRGLHKRERGAAAAADPAGGSDAAGAAGQGRQIGKAGAH